MDKIREKINAKIAELNEAIDGTEREIETLEGEVISYRKMISFLSTLLHDLKEETGAAVSGISTIGEVAQKHRKKAPKKNQASTGKASKYPTKDGRTKREIILDVLRRRWTDPLTSEEIAADAVRLGLVTVGEKGTLKGLQSVLQAEIVKTIKATGREIFHRDVLSDDNGIKKSCYRAAEPAPTGGD